MVIRLYFLYGETETAYLAGRDKRLGEAIERIGPIRREVDSDLFSSVVHHIVGQQISTAAQATIWRRMGDGLGQVNAETVCAAGQERLQAFGISFRKADYILDFARRVRAGSFDIESLKEKSDGEVVAELSALRGIGEWTAEMLLTFCLQRPDVMSFGDLAIHRGLRMLHHHRSIDRKLFDKYRRRYSPYGTVASLYLWAIAGGAVEGMRDYAPKKKAVKP